MQGRRLDTIGLTRRTHEREEQQRQPPSTVLALHVGLAAGGVRAGAGTAAGKARQALLLSSGAIAFQSRDAHRPLFWAVL